MFSKQSVKNYLHQIFPDHELEKGFLEQFRTVLENTLKRINYADKDFKDIKKEVQKAFSKRVYLLGEKYLKDWSDYEKKTQDEDGLSGKQHLQSNKYSKYHGIYPWPLGLILNPRQIERDIFIENKKQIAAYIVFVIEQALNDEVISCIRKNMIPTKHRIPLSLLQRCA